MFVQGLAPLLSIDYRFLSARWPRSNTLTLYQLLVSGYNSRAIVREILRQGSYIYGYSIVSSKESFYIFGGVGDGFKGSNVIARFQTTTKQWKKLGELKQPRSGLGVIKLEDEFIVFGGEDKKKTERCSMNGDSIQCVTVGFEYDDYWFYPELMSVPQSYCST